MGVIGQWDVTVKSSLTATTTYYCQRSELVLQYIVHVDYMDVCIYTLY